jgi:acyl-CoA thioesterase
MSMHVFDADTLVKDLGGDASGVRRFEASMSRRWWIVRGPNGGYVAAVLLRAMTAAVDDAARAVRSLTIHYTAPPAEAPCTIETRIERTGRSLTTISARMTQGDRLLALALGAFSVAWPATVEIADARMPDVVLPGDAPDMSTARPNSGLPLHDQYDYRWAVGGPPYSSSPEALCGGWIRFAEPRTLDAMALSAISDAWPPTVMSSLAPGTTLGGMPTVDLTIHFRTTNPAEGLRREDHVLAVFRCRTAREGFFEEDGEIWSPRGVLLAQSRQLAILM